MPAVLSGLAERGEALAALDVQLKPEGQRPRYETHIRPAAPTMEGVGPSGGEPGIPAEASAVSHDGGVRVRLIG